MAGHCEAGGFVAAVVDWDGKIGVGVLLIYPFQILITFE
jgi:hypothetical protein